MFRQKHLLVLAVVLAFALIPAVSAQSNIVVAFFESFSDGEVTSNPTWSFGIGDASAMTISNGELHADGVIHDASGRYSIQLFTPVGIETTDYLELSFRGFLKSTGNPQEGRHISFVVKNTDLGLSYGIEMSRGSIGGWPTNQFALVFPGGQRVISTSYAPLRDTWYEVRAIRQGGTWRLYVDGIEVGSTVDTVNLNSINIVQIGRTVGSIIADDFEIKVSPPNQPPDCSGATPSIDLLWPANHQFVTVDVLGVTDPNGDQVTIIIDSIFQDEPVDSTGDGAFVPDGQGVGTAQALLRAERVGSGNGRYYHINFSADDGQGGVCSGEVLVGVPKSQGSNGAPIDDGALYDSTQ